MKKAGYILMVALVLVSCHGAKYYVKQGEKYAKERDYDNAVANYAEAYSMDPNNKDAKKGFRKYGQKLLDELLEEMQASHQSGNYKEAVQQYKKADKFYNKVKDRGIDLDFPDDARTLYQSALGNYLRDVYLDAANAINAGNYTAAKSYIEELKSNDPNYEGLAALELAYTCDPIYMKGVDAYNKGQKLIAVQYFTKVSKMNPDYRETATFLAELNKLPKQMIAIFPVENKSREQYIERDVYKAVERSLMEMQSSLLSIADETMVQNELLKANKYTQPPFDDITVLQVSKTMLATKAVLITVADITEEPLANSENFQIAYARERVIFWDPYYGQTTQYRWRETKYKEVEEGVKYAVYIKIKIYDPQTGQLVLNDVVNKSVISKVKYARYDGDYNDLYPTTGYISQTELNKWRSRFTAEKDRKSKSELLGILVNAATDEINEMIFSRLN